MASELSCRFGCRIAETARKLGSKSVDPERWTEDALDTAAELTLEAAVINGVFELDVDYWSGSQGSGKSTVTCGIADFSKKVSTRWLPVNVGRKIRMYSQNPIVMGTGGVMSSPKGEYHELTAPIAEASKLIVERGELAPDSFAVAAAALMTAYRLSQAGYSKDGYGGVVFDGFPRSVKQREIWRRFIGEIFDDQVNHNEIMLVPLPKDYEVNKIATLESVRGAKVFADVIERVGKLDVVGSLDEYGLNGDTEVCRVLAMGLADIRCRLINQASDQIRVDATEDAVIRRLQGFYKNTSDLWPGSLVVNSNQPPAAVTEDVLKKLGFDKNGDPKVTEFVNGVAMSAQSLVRG